MQNFNEDYYPREFDLGEIISIAWNFIKDNFQPLLLIGIIIYAPINLVASFVPIESIFPSMAQITPFAGGNTLMLSFLDFFFGIIATVAIINVIDRRFKRQEIDFLESLKFSFGIWHFSLLTMILTVVVILLLTMLLIIPGIIAMVFLAFTMYAVAMRGVWGNNALKYSYRLVSGRWWKTLGYLIVFGLLVLFLQFLVTMPFMLFGDSPILNFISGTLSSILNIFSIVLIGMFFINMEDTHPNKEKLQEIGVSIPQSDEIIVMHDDEKRDDEKDENQ